MTSDFSNSSSDDCTITPEDAVVIFPDGTMRRIKAQQVLRLKGEGRAMSPQEENFLAATLRRKK